MESSNQKNKRNVRFQQIQGPQLRRHPQLVWQNHQWLQGDKNQMSKGFQKKQATQWLGRRIPPFQNIQKLGRRIPPFQNIQKLGRRIPPFQNIQKLGRRIPPFQNIQKLRRRIPQINQLPRRQIPIPHARKIQQLRRWGPQPLDYQQLRSLNPRTQMNQLPQRQNSQSRNFQQFGKRVPQFWSNRLRILNPRTQTNQLPQMRNTQAPVFQQLGRLFPQTQRIRKQYLQAQTIRQPRSQARQAFQNPNIAKNIQQKPTRNQITFFTPLELLQLAPHQDKKLWELIVNRLPHDYSIPDPKFINLYKAFIGQ